MDTLDTIELKRDFGAYEETMSSEDFKEEEDEEEGEKSNFELELLSAIRTANDELYALASEGVDDKNYLKMKSNSPVSDYPFVA